LPDAHPVGPASQRRYDVPVGEKDFPHISFDTVNRSLITFTDIGVVEVFGGRKRFDPDIDGPRHLHCSACGKIIDFENDGYSDLDVPETIAGTFTVIRKRVVLKGLCDACATG